jgi:hypothetical protein
MTVRTVQVPTDAGIAVTMNAAASGDQFAVDDSVLLIVKNGDASSHDVTLTTPNTEGGLAIADRTVTVAAGATEAILVGHARYADTGGLCSLAWSATTSMTWGVVRV